MHKTCSIHILLALTLIHEAFQDCYKLKMLSCITTDTKFYGLSVKLHNFSSLSSLSSVRREVKTPMWRVTLLETKGNQQKIHYNGIVKSCEIINSFKRVRFLREMASSFFMNSEKGNLSIECPLPIGEYVMKNIFVPPDSYFMRFVYSPNSMYTLNGAVLSLLPNKRMEKLCTYSINATIVKSCKKSFN